MAEKYRSRSCACEADARSTCNAFSCHAPSNYDPDVFWYQQSWPHYNYWFWWNDQQRQRYGGPQQANSFTTWCSTCAEEQEQREQRAMLAEKRNCDDKSNFGEQILLGENSSSTRQNAQNSRFQHYTESASNNEGTSFSCGFDFHDGCISDGDESSSDEFEMELNSDFKKFLEQTAKHKEQRRKETEQSQVESDDYIEASEIALRATSAPPTQQQNVVRTDEMKKLYGKSSYRIESLETSLQLRFNMNVDIRRPRFWPVIPLKF